MKGYINISKSTVAVYAPVLVQKLPTEEWMQPLFGWMKKNHWTRNFKFGE